MQKNQVIIFGDSYSTFRNYVPEGYAIYYTGNQRHDQDLTTVEETWWHQVIAETNASLLQNNSWSGSTIGYTGYNNTDCSQTSSFICRLQKLIEQGFFENNTVDTVFVFGGTNDGWANAPLGTLQYENWKKEDLYQVLPAICCFLKTLKETLPNADIYCLVNTELKPEIADGIKKTCARFEVTPITFEQIDMINGHPTVQGMRDIKNQVLAQMREK